MKTITGKIDCRIAALREERGITQDQLVNAVRGTRDPLIRYFDRVTLSKAEGGVIILIPAHVQAVADTLHCMPRDIYPDMYPC